MFSSGHFLTVVVKIRTSQRAMPVHRNLDSPPASADFRFMEQAAPRMTPTDTPPEATRPEVCILMGMYNGAAHLQDQLDSYIAQSHRNWSLIISDDGSTDESPRIARAFARAHPDRAIEIRPGPRRGFARNFLSLLQAAPGDVPFVALSDQDDVWFPARLERAVKALHVMDPATPALYCGATLVCDETLAPLGVSATLRRDPDFRNALVQSIGGGNTMVLNHAATALAAAAAAEASDPVSHDWWLYQIVTGCGGVVLHDPDPVAVLPAAS